jgi:uncharacterized protein (DUF433 family)
MSRTLELPDATYAALERAAQASGTTPAGWIAAHLPAAAQGERAKTGTASWVSKRPDYCGGHACIRDTRITVWGIVNYRRLGASDADILRFIQGLTPADLEAAWEYAAAHSEEIDQAIRENEEGEEGFVE